MPALSGRLGSPYDAQMHRGRTRERQTRTLRAGALNAIAFLHPSFGYNHRQWHPIFVADEVPPDLESNCPTSQKTPPLQRPQTRERCLKSDTQMYSPVNPPWLPAPIAVSEKLLRSA
jgi:hypothetical protein